MTAAKATVNRPDDLDGLLARARAGEGAAWGELVERYGPLVLAVARDVGLGEADQEEVFQETWLALWRQLDLLASNAALPGWIAVTARRQAIKVVDQRTRRRDREHRAVEDASREPTPAGDEFAERAEERVAVRRALGRLPERCRVLLEALFFTADDSSYEGLSRRLGIARGSIGPTRQRCLLKLAELLADEADRSAPRSSTFGRIREDRGSH